MVFHYYFSASGIYQFDAYMMGQSGENYFWIMKNGSAICSGYVAPQNNPAGTGTCGVNVQLEVGDQIYVKASGHYNGGYCGFSGFMVKSL